MTVPSFHGWHVNVHHFEMTARARIDDAKRRAMRGAERVRLGVHRKPEPKPNIFQRIWRKLRSEETAGSV